MRLHCYHCGYDWEPKAGQGGHRIIRQKQCPNCKYQRWDDPGAPKVGERATPKSPLGPRSGSARGAIPVHGAGQRVVSRGGGVTLVYDEPEPGSGV